VRCPFCGSVDSRVVDSRDVEDGVRRRRECLNGDCGGRFTTYERVQAVALFVVKKDGRREEFSRGKLLAGLHKACEKRPLATGAIESLAAEIEAALYAAGPSEIASKAVGELVIERLRGLDPIAYVRFASVYREFADIEALREELDDMASAARPAGAQLPLLSGAEYSPTSLRLQPAAPNSRTRTRRPVRPVQTPATLPAAESAPAKNQEPRTKNQGRRRAN
jgi:transcriptional repressor NrdR